MRYPWLRPDKGPDEDIRPAVGAEEPDPSVDRADEGEFEVSSLSSATAAMRSSPRAASSEVGNHYRHSRNTRLLI
jgi:hypothetical protein